MRPALVVAALLIALLLGASGAWAQTPGPCQRAALPSSSITLTCVPAQGWNGDLILYAHGYVAPRAPLDVQHLTLPDGADLPTLVQRAGFAFATTSFRRNGLAVLEGVEDLRELRSAFATGVAPPRRTFAAGVSEGGLVTTLLAERHPEELTGALATCAPSAGLRAQLEYIGDTRVVFDHFFPRVLPGSAIDVPTALAATWERVYRPRVQRAVARRPRIARGVVRAAGGPRLASRRELTTTLVNVLRYSAVATRDAVAKLGGNPYGNVRRRYSGSVDDRRLNRRVQRFRANPAALAALRAYAPTGRPGVPLVALHTTRDEVVPFRHATRYAARALRARAPFALVPIRRFGHCRVRAAEVLEAFALLARS